jgi:hypothetical protein
VLRARWIVSRDLPPHKRWHDLDGQYGQRPLELMRAQCGRRCGGVLGYYWADDWKHLNAYRLPPGMAYRRHGKESQYPYGHFELSPWAQKQRREWMQDGGEPYLWWPTPRHRNVTQEEYQAAVTATVSHGAIPGVLEPMGRRHKWPQFLVDPDATGGVVIVRCPQCTWPNEVGGPSSALKEAGA